MRVRGGGWTSPSGQVVTYATIDAGDGEPQTTVTFRSGDWGCDLLVAFTPTPRQHWRQNDSGHSRQWVYR